MAANPCPHMKHHCFPSECAGSRHPAQHRLGCPVRLVMHAWEAKLVTFLSPWRGVSLAQLAVCSKGQATDPSVLSGSPYPVGTGASVKPPGKAINFQSHAPGRLGTNLSPNKSTSAFQCLSWPSPPLFVAVPLGKAKCLFRC